MRTKMRTLAIPLLTAVAVLAALLVVAPAPARADGAAIKWLCPQQNWQIQELHDADQTIPEVPAAISGCAGS
jgi:hypothetical protein